MKIFLLAQFMGDMSDPNLLNSRFLTIADMLIDRGHEVVLVTTNFVHNSKKHINHSVSYKGCKVVLLDEPGYQKNVCLKRIKSHKVLAKNLRAFLNNCEKPDVLYCAVPSLDFAYEAAMFAKNNSIRFVLDIQDLWPEAFEMVIPSQAVNKILFSSWRKKADFIYSSADSLIAVSQTYINRGLKGNNAQLTADVVYLGTSLEKFDTLKKDIPQRADNEILLGYAGTLGNSYDLYTVFDAMEVVCNKLAEYKIKLLVMGDGPLRKDFEDYAGKKNINVSFTGLLAYGNMVPELCGCDIVINPIKKNSAGSIINKHADYAASGIAVLNTQESDEYRNLINEYQMGINCNCEDSSDVADKLIWLIQNKEERLKMGKQARKCAEDKFNRSLTYKTIVKRIING